MSGQCLHMCCDCLCVIALFRAVMLLVHDWAALSLWTGTGIGYCQTNSMGSRIFGKYLSAL